MAIMIYALLVMNIFAVLTPTKVYGQKYGGTLVLRLPTDPPHLNPVNNLLTTHHVTGQIYSALLEYDFDTNPKPSLAKSWDVSDDLLTYTFHLVDNATWFDGVPFTSADVKFSFEEIIIPLHPEGAIFEVVESIETPDDYTVVFKLKHPYVPILKFLGHRPSAILPKHIYEGTDILKNPHNFENPIGTGPFKLEEWVRGDHLILVRNENYWKQGLPYLDRIIYRIIPDITSALLALENGEIGYIFENEVPLIDIDRLRQISGITVLAKGGEMSPAVVTFGFNLRREITGNLKVRQAMAHAVNLTLINELATAGKAMIPNGPVHPVSPFYNPDVTKYEYDIDKANKLLDEAGYPKDASGTRFSLTFVTRANYPDWVKPGEILRDQLKRVGITIVMLPLDAAAYYPRVYEKWDFDIASVSWGAGPDVSKISIIYDSAQIKHLIFTNFMGYNNSRVDQLFGQGVMEADPEGRKEIYDEIQDLIVKDLPALWLVATRRYPAFDSNYVGLPPGPYYGGRDAFDRVWWNLGTLPSPTIPPEITAAISNLENKAREIEIIAYAAIVIGIIAIIVGMLSLRRRS